MKQNPQIYVTENVVVVNRFNDVTCEWMRITRQ